jgi:hypothetical protein
MAFPNERTFVVDNLIVNNKIVSGTAGSPVTVGGLSLPTAAGVTGGTAGTTNGGVSFLPYTIYSYFPSAGTPWLQPSANNAAKILDQFTLPGNTLAAGRSLSISIYGVHTGNNTNVCTPTINLGGTGAIGATITGGATAGTFNMIVAQAPFAMFVDIYVQAAGTLQRAYAQANGGATAVLLPTDTALTNDFTSNLLVNLTMNNVTTATDASVYGWTVQVF